MRIAFILQGYAVDRLRLQPWRYYKELSSGLTRLGHEVAIFTDAAPPVPEHSMALASVRATSSNRGLVRAVNSWNPDIGVWAATASMFTYLDKRTLSAIGIPLVALFPGPLTTRRDVWSWGAGLAFREWSYVRNHVIDAFIPKPVVRRGISECFRGSFAMGQSTIEELKRAGIQADRLHSTPMGRDSELDALLTKPLSDQDLSLTALYMGSPLELRGVYDFISAARLLEDEFPSLNVQILSRRRGGEYERQMARLRHATVGTKVTLNDGFLTPGETFDAMVRATMVVLPFRIIQSGIPVALLEVLATGRPLVTTSLPAIRDYIPRDTTWMAEPGKPTDLARQMRECLRSPSSRALRSSAARAAIRALPSWDEVCTAFAKKLEEIRR